ncbi:MAG: hypothetical protein IKV74_04480 [Clostridia bacterium]|nr:hypothetical protein [Clostridia bacterium]
MKRFFALVLTIVMVFCITACGKDTDIRGTFEGGSSAAPSTTPEKGSFSVGSVNANKYVNKFAGISCELGSDWTFMTDEQIKQNNETALGQLGGDYAELIQNADTFTDMMATHKNETDTLNITFEKLKGVNALMSEERYIESSIDSLKDAFASMGFGNLKTDSGKVNFAGKERHYLDVSGTYSGIAMYERMIVMKCDNYVVLVTVCTWQTNTCQDVLNMFIAA